MLSLYPSRDRPRVRGHPRRRRVRVGDLLISDGSVAAREPATGADDSGGGGVGVGSPRAESPTAADGKGRRRYVSSRNKLSVSPIRFLPQMHSVFSHVPDPVGPPSKGGVVILGCVRRDSAETDTETDRGTERGRERAIYGLGHLGIGLVASFPTLYRRLSIVIN